MPETLRLTGGHFDCVGGDRCGCGIADWWMIICIEVADAPGIIV